MAQNLKTNTPVPFKVDDLIFDKITSADEGEFIDDALPQPGTLEVTERYEVVRQPVPGFKTITQATEPEALKVLHFVVQTYTKADRDALDGLNNYAPHEVTCGLLTESPLWMYLETKARRYPRTGCLEYNIEWDITLVEMNDNN